jgi:hypothetical protein
MVGLFSSDCVTDTSNRCARLRSFIATKVIARLRECVCKRAFLASRVHSGSKKRRKKWMQRERSKRETCLFVSCCKSASVRIRIWCWFMIHHKKVRPSTCLKLVMGDRPYLSPFFSSIAFQNFHLADLELGRKKLEEKKKSGSESSEMGPDLPSLPSPHPSL